MAGGDFVRCGLNDRDESQFRLYQLCADQAAGRLEGADFNSAFFSHPKCDPLTLSPQSGDPQVLGRARQGLYPDSLLPGPGAGTELHHEHLDRQRL